MYDTKEYMTRRIYFKRKKTHEQYVQWGNKVEIRLIRKTLIDSTTRTAEGQSAKHTSDFTSDSVCASLALTGSEETSPLGDILSNRLNGFTVGRINDLSLVLQ